MVFETFKQQIAIKHNADLAVGDVILLDDGNNFNREDKTFIRAVCDGHCGKDEFFGFNETTGCRISWSDNDLFKIVGKNISI